MDAIDQYLEAIKRRGLREQYVSRVEDYLRLFSKLFWHHSPEDIDARMLEAWFEVRGEKPVTRSSNLGVLSGFFSFCQRQGWCQDNPCRRVERIYIDRRPPKILTAGQVQTLMSRTSEDYPSSLLWLVLAVVVGIRPSEINRLTVAEVARELEDGILIIDAAASKVRRRRIIELTRFQKLWIGHALCKSPQLPIPKVTIRRRVRRWRDWLLLNDWTQDILRHTALSFQLTISKDAARVSLFSGTSVRMLMTHYNGLATPSEAAKFLQMEPFGAKGMDLRLSLSMQSSSPYSLLAG